MSKKSVSLRILGDIHGKLGQYVKLATEAEYSIQLGDVGFNYSYLKRVLDSNYHKIIAGNHDNYDTKDGKFFMQTDHFLGDFGTYEVLGKKIFFVRGGFSIDKARRMIGVSWFPEEELTYREGVEAIQAYDKAKPDIVITHECPESLIEFVATLPGKMITPSSTARLLQAMFETHQPKMWFFGHHHRDWVQEVEGTTFRCLDELSYFDFE